MAPRRDSPPLWFVLCVTVALAGAMRLWVSAAGVLDGAPGHTPPVSYAFLQFIIPLISLLFKGAQIAARVTLAALHWVVVNLSLVVTKIGNGLKALGSDLLKGLKRGWDFTRKLYDDVLKPAWTRFWRWFDKFVKWLDRTVRPVLKFLKRLRDNLLKFYNSYVRPWLDTIEVTRRLLRVLAILHVPFARELDARLGRLQAWIQWPFQFALAKINEIINVVNRVVTLDGLIQRVALIRSLARDYQFAWRAMTQPYHRAVTAEDRQKTRLALAQSMILAGVPETVAVAIIAAGATPKPPATIDADLRQYIRYGGGPHAVLLDEMTLVWRKQLQAALQ